MKLNQTQTLRFLFKFKFSIPDRNKPEPNNIRQLTTSERMPPINLLIA
jgi:hypothetical protein